MQNYQILFYSIRYFIHEYVNIQEKISYALAFLQQTTLVECNMKYFHFIHSSTESRHRAVYRNFKLMYFIRHLKISKKKKIHMMQCQRNAQLSRIYTNQGYKLFLVIVSLKKPPCVNSQKESIQAFNNTYYFKSLDQQYAVLSENLHIHQHARVAVMFI